MEYSKNVNEILNKCLSESKNLNLDSCGSEYLILAMYDVGDSLCHFLLDEYDVKREEIVEIINNIYIIRKSSGEFNNSLKDILKNASIYSSGTKIDDSHVFRAILDNKNIIACEILEMLGLDIEELKKDIVEIYDFNLSEIDYTKNISLMAKNNELVRFIGRDDLLFRIDLIINRKSKCNPILIGDAGVGKSALVEGYASMLNKRGSDLCVLSLNLSLMIGGTKYRGDFEERFNKFMDNIISRGNVILFIDEIHTIMGAGTTEGNLDVCNMLKPLLARSDVKIIGATTYHEYHKYIEKDKALTRRFQPVYVVEPSKEENYKIIHGIKEDYFKFHGVRVCDDIVDYIINEADLIIKNRKRPDKCIDILDDVLSYKKLTGCEIGKCEVLDIINKYLGCSGSGNLDIYFKELEKYLFLYQNNLILNNVLCRIKYVGNDLGISKLANDLINLFKLSPEMILELDFKEYDNNFEITKLIGAPPGYVGYSDEGILVKHLGKYLMPVIIIKNYNLGCNRAIGIINSIFNCGYIYDNYGEKITCNNAIFVISKSNDDSIGFILEDSDKDYDEVIVYNDLDKVNYNQIYDGLLKKYNIKIPDNFLINNENKRDIDEIIYKRYKSGCVSEELIIN